MILMFGDLHGNFDHVIQLVKTIKPVAIILLGDIEAQQPLELELELILSMTEIYFIHGNHDTDSKENYSNLFLSALADRNLHGRIVEIDGLKVAGLGGVFREHSWYPRFDMKDAPLYKNYDSLIKAHSRKRGLKNIESEKDDLAHGEVYKRRSYDLPSHDLEMGAPSGNELRHKSTIFYDDWKRLSRQRADILVTHEAPSCHPGGFIGIDELARSMHVKKSFHGHKHDNLDYRDKHPALRFAAYGVGFRGASDQDGNLIAKGDFDDENARRYYNNKRIKEK